MDTMSCDEIKAFTTRANQALSLIYNIVCVILNLSYFTYRYYCQLKGKEFM